MLRLGEIPQGGIAYLEDRDSHLRRELLQNQRRQRKNAVIAMTTIVACSLANSCITGGEPKLDDAREILRAVCDSKRIEIKTLIGTTDFDDELRESPERFLVRKSLALMGTLWPVQVDDYPGDISRIIGCCQTLQKFGYDLGLVKKILCERYGFNPEQFRYRVKPKIQAVDNKHREDAYSYFVRTTLKAYDECPEAWTTIPADSFGVNINLPETPVPTDDGFGIDGEP